MFKAIIILFLILPSASFAMTAEEELAQVKLELLSSQLDRLKLMADIKKANDELVAKEAEIEAVKEGRSEVVVVDENIY